MTRYLSQAFPAVYVGYVSDSDTATATIRWFLMSLVTAATVAIFYLLASSAGWSFGMASVYLIAASALGCFALTLAWFIRAHYSTPTEGVRVRLDRIATPTSRPGSIESRIQAITDEDPQIVEQAPQSTMNEQVESDTGRSPSLVDPESTPPIEPSAHRGESPPPAKETGEQEETSDDVPLSQSTKPVPLRLASVSSQQSRPEPETALVAEPPIEAPDEDAAKHLAELLNRYERDGFPTGGPSNEPMADIQREGQSTGDRELWAHLVEAYGAESVDLRDISSGSCRIILSSGDIVFYAPQRRCWMWIIFEQAEDATVLRHAPPSAPERVVSNPG